MVTAILCSVLLVWGQAWLTPVASAATCAKMRAMPCCHNGMMSCCAAKAAGTAKPVASAPLRGSVAAPLALIMALALAWQWSQLLVRQLTARRLVPVAARKAPLYARDCARLI